MAMIHWKPKRRWQSEIMLPGWQAMPTDTSKSPRINERFNNGDDDFYLSGSLGNIYATRSGSGDGDSPYHYVLTKWVCVLFIALFGISAKSQRLSWLRTFLIATNFVVLGKIIRSLGPQYCRMTQKWYTIVFISCDTVALVVQSIGGGIASGTQPVLGGHIALGGIVLQFVALLFFTFIAREFLLRFAFDRPIRHAYEGGVNNMRGVADGNIRLTILGLSTMTTFLLIRSIYRTVELSDGWTGAIISTQWLFNAFDGAMIVLATFTLNILHPGVLLRGHDRVEVGISAEKFIGSTRVQSVWDTPEPLF